MATAKVTGNTAGLKESVRRALERTFLRRTSPDALVSVELAKHLCTLSRQMGRQLGVLIDRRGHVTSVFVGEPSRIYLPELGRARAGLANRRGLRHVHTVLHSEGVCRDDLADLTKLRLDAVVALGCGPDGEPQEVHYAFLRREVGRSAFGQAERAASVHELPLDFAERIASLTAEERSLRAAPVAAAAAPRAMLVGVYPRREHARARLDELRELADTAGLAVHDEVVQVRRHVEPSYVLGRGRLEEVVLQCLDAEVDLLVFDHELTPAQARAIAALSELKVIDRTQLILDIFASHAHTRDGKLQVELAQLKYNLPRLTDLDAGLSRLTGGIGGRGPGETKLEINRRRARARIGRLEDQIDALGRERQTRRQRRYAGQEPIVSIVGYTNAGKSTLMRRLSRSDVLVADMLFATLDATSRRIYLPSGRYAVLTDTVGFIRDLPADLLRAFRSTLEELEGADLLLHVVDVADEDRPRKTSSVVDVLDGLGLSRLPMLTVLNKADKVEPFFARGLAEQLSAVAVSAGEGTGIEALMRAIDERLVAARPPASSDDGGPNPAAR